MLPLCYIAPQIDKYDELKRKPHRSAFLRNYLKDENMYSVFAHLNKMVKIYSKLASPKPDLTEASLTQLMPA